MQNINIYVYLKKILTFNSYLAIVLNSYYNNFPCRSNNAMLT